MENKKRKVVDEEEEEKDVLIEQTPPTVVLTTTDDYIGDSIKRVISDAIKKKKKLKEEEKEGFPLLDLIARAPTVVLSTPPTQPTTDEKLKLIQQAEIERLETLTDWSKDYPIEFTVDGIKYHSTYMILSRISPYFQSSIDRDSNTLIDIQEPWNQCRSEGVSFNEAYHMMITRKGNHLKYKEEKQICDYFGIIDSMIDWGYCIITITRFFGDTSTMTILIIPYQKITETDRIELDNLYVEYDKPKYCTRTKQRNITSKLLSPQEAARVCEICLNYSEKYPSCDRVRYGHEIWNKDSRPLVCEQQTIVKRYDFIHHTGLHLTEIID